MSPLAWTIHVGDALEVLRTLVPIPSDHQPFQTVVTSPPYWQLRDYGVDGQLGMEKTLAEYLDKLVEVFAAVRTLLRDDGTLWINMGDSYIGNGGGNNGQHVGLNHWRVGGRTSKKAETKLANKNLVGVPWRLAFALQDDGWILRSEIIWHKPAPVPESVRDRPTRSHEHVFLFAKSPRYFWDAEAASEEVTGGAHPRGSGLNRKARAVTPANWDPTPGAHRTLAHNAGGKTARRIRTRQNASWSGTVKDTVERRNMRTVWTIPPEPTSEDHYAAFPSEVPRRCIAASSRPGDLVLDPFCGIGRTGLAAARLGRGFMGIELNPRSAAAARRIAAGPLYADHLKETT